MRPGERDPQNVIPKAAAARLSLYLRHLESLRITGAATTSSKDLAKALGVTAAQVRKDLGYFGQFGSPGIGYKIENLIVEIRKILGTDRIWNVALVGLGNLGSALFRYRGFVRQGFRITAIFDKNPAVIGRQVEGLLVKHINELERTVSDADISLGIMAVPAESAQEVADCMVRAGISGIFNFAPAVLSLPANVAYVSIDLTVQLEQLSFHVKQLKDEMGSEYTDG
ncbi:MAG: redox-sensing transcriptional repressor Rex [Planctomycetes bacterium]|nr:redox-sensing transcriptional repressor Rex [Planctomycetota bacterium]